MEGLCAALRLALGTAEGAGTAQACAGIVDWPAVGRLATHHRIRPLLLKGLGAAEDRIGGGFAQRLGDLRLQPQRRGLRQLAALPAVCSQLAASGVDCIVLKGLPLSQRLHGNPLARESIDIDLLVSPDLFGTAEELLLDQGWRRARPDFPQTPRRKRWHDGLVKDALYVPRRGGVAVELHRRLLNNPHLFNAPFGDLLEEGATQTVAGHAYRVLGDVHLLPYLACHGLEHCWHRLKWLCDFVALEALDAEGFTALAGACRGAGLAVALDSAMNLAAPLRASPTAVPKGRTPGGARSRLVAGLAHAEWAGEAAGGWRWAFRSAKRTVSRFLWKGDFRYALFEVARLLIAPHDLGRSNLPDRWLWLAPLLRPAVWIGKALGLRPSRRSAN